MSLFLTPKEIAEVTGWATSKKQRDWLARNGFAFMVNRKGQIIISRAYLEQKLGYKNVVLPPEGRKPSEPNYDALKKFA